VEGNPACNILGSSLWYLVYNMQHGWHPSLMAYMGSIGSRTSPPLPRAYVHARTRARMRAHTRAQSYTHIHTHTHTYTHTHTLSHSLSHILSPCQRMPCADLQVYDAAQDVWQQRAPAPHAHEHAETFVHAGRLWIVGGKSTLWRGAPIPNDPSLLQHPFHHYRMSSTLASYDPATNAWVDTYMELPVRAYIPMAQLVRRAGSEKVRIQGLISPLHMVLLMHCGRMPGFKGTRCWRCLRWMGWKRRWCMRACWLHAHVRSCAAIARIPAPSSVPMVTARAPSRLTDLQCLVDTVDKR
jgi:hypothetical protein